jgi:hypothetical protein
LQEGADEPEDGRMIPKKNIHPWPFLSVMMPRKMSSNTYKEQPPEANSPPHGSSIHADRLQITLVPS